MPRWMIWIVLRIAALFGKKEQAVVVHFRYGSLDLQPIRALEASLEKAIDAAGVGDFDGDEIAVSGRDGYLYMYGPDADRLFAVVRPILEAARFMNGARVTRVYGALGTHARRTGIAIACR